MPKKKLKEEPEVVTLASLRETLSLGEEVEDAYLLKAVEVTDRLPVIRKLGKLFDKKIAQQIEQGIFRFSLTYPLVKGKPIGQQESIYEDNAAFLLKELDPSSLPKNEDILRRLKEGEIEPERLAFFSPQELNPKHWEKPLKKKEYRAFKAKNMATTNKYTCKKCKGNRHSITQKQMSSADEPMTTFITCLDCGKTIKYRA